MGLLDFLFGAHKEDDTGAYEMGSNQDTMNEQVGDGIFSMIIEDIFTITGRGTIVTGRVECGSVAVGENVYLTDTASGAEKIVKVTGVEMFRKTLQVANEGDLVGLLLRGVERNDVHKGDLLHK